jgi:hypothetical protein
MKRLQLISLLLGTLVLIGGGQAAVAATSDDDACRPVHARGVGQDLGGGNTTATITRGGILNGTTNAHFDIIGGTPPALTFEGTIVFTTKKGTLTASISGTFNVATGAFAATGAVTGGTGRFAGATGTLSLAGVEDLATGSFTETVTGTLCLAEDDDEG